MTVSGVVLAAGAGTRLGMPKAEVRIDGERLVDRAVRVLREGGCSEVVAVLRAGVVVDGAITVVNPAPERGMGSSLRLGLAAASGARAAVLLVDTPGVGADAVARVLAVPSPVAVATYGGRRGHPVVIDRPLWTDVARLATGDHGARPFLLAHPDLVTEVACDGDPGDIDTGADLARWQTRSGPTAVAIGPTAVPVRSSGMTFGFDSTALDVVGGLDLRGRNAIVTGGASGLGAETVRALATAGARVLIAARDPARAAPVAARLREDTGNAEIDVAELDLASLASVRALVARVLADGRDLHILVDNAGVMAGPLGYTPDGFESQFGTNHVGHYALTVGLLPALRRSGDARVVVLSSIGHRRGDVDFDDLDFRQRPYDPWVAYAQSKTANALFAVGMTQRHGGDGITTNAVNPGFIPTRLQRHMTRAELQDRGWVDAAGRPIRRDGQKTPEQGAATSVWAAVAPELTGSGGHYLEDCAIAAPWTGPGELRRGYLPYALDPSNAERLWAVTASRIAGA